MTMQPMDVLRTYAKAKAQIKSLLEHKKHIEAHILEKRLKRLLSRYIHQESADSKA